MSLWSVHLSIVIPWRFHRVVNHYQCLHIQLVEVSRYRKRGLLSNFPSTRLYTAFLLTITSDLCLVLPGIIEGHLGNLDVHLHRVVMWMVPPVGDGLLIGCRYVWQVLKGDRNMLSVALVRMHPNRHAQTKTMKRNLVMHFYSCKSMQQRLRYSVLLHFSWCN